VTSENDLRYEGSICISGLTASGKTTHSHLLAGEFGLTYVSGSQIQLNMLGVSPIQTRDFWITVEAKKLWNRDQFKSIDAELLRLEARAQGYIFDTSTMPWRHQERALCIWLESDLDSRVRKAIVSHRGRGGRDLATYLALIADKDQATKSLYNDLYGIEIGHDLSPFDLILDISDLIAEPTFDASLSSIQITHEFIRAASAHFLTGRQEFADDFRRAAARRPGLVAFNRIEILK
jgi:cytidylate kinase